MAIMRVAGEAAEAVALAVCMAVMIMMIVAVVMVVIMIMVVMIVMMVIMPVIVAVAGIGAAHRHERSGDFGDGRASPSSIALMTWSRRTRIRRSSICAAR